MSDPTASGDMAKRNRVFSTIVYPESAPDNWMDILEDFKIQALISPLHDKDLNPTGEPKKPHYHIEVIFDSPKTRDQVISLFSQIGGVGCEVVNSTRGMARYLTHMDNPEKYRYSEDDVKILGGADYWDIINLPSDKYALIGDILDFVIENRVSNIIDLFRYVRDLNLYDWYRVVVDNTFLFSQYCKAVKDRKLEITEGKVLMNEKKEKA